MVWVDCHVIQFLINFILWTIFGVSLQILCGFVWTPTWFGVGVPCNRSSYMLCKSLIWIKIREREDLRCKPLSSYKNFHLHGLSKMNMYANLLHFELLSKSICVRILCKIYYEWIPMARRQNDYCYLANHIYWTHIELLLTGRP